MSVRALPFLALALGVGLLAACDASTEAPASETVGVFDDAPYLASAVADEWTWVDAPESMCRDGSSSGIGVRGAPGSTKLLILLQGGGACLDAGSCATNPASFGEDDFDALIAVVGDAGVFDAGNAANPFRDWNAVFVPYCTGDVHSGSNADGFVPGVEGVQRFVGYQNLQTYLARLGPRLDRAERVVLSGVSAGGFGTVGTYGLFADAFAPTPVDLLDDSGPVPADDLVLNPALQGAWRALWNLAPALPDGCAECTQPDGDGLENVLPYYARQYPERHFGLVSYEQDVVIRSFFGGILPTCTPENPLGCLIPAEAFEASLYDLRALYPENVDTYYVEGSAHTFLLGEQFYTATVGGTSLADWTATFLAGGAPDVPATTGP